MITFPEILQCFQVFQTNSKSKATYFHIHIIVFSPCVKMYKPACLTWAYLAFIWKASGIWSNGAISQFHLEDTCWAHSTESLNPLKMQDVLAQILFWSYMFITYSKFRRKKNLPTIWLWHVHLTSKKSLLLRNSWGHQQFNPLPFMEVSLDNIRAVTNF